MTLGYRVCSYTGLSSVRDANQTPLHSSSPFSKTEIAWQFPSPSLTGMGNHHGCPARGAEKANNSASLVFDQSCHLVTVTAICSMLGTRQLNLI